MSDTTPNTARHLDEHAVPAVALRETCRVVAGRVPLWPYHRQRLTAGGCGSVLLDDADVRVKAAAAEWSAAPGSRARLTATVSPRGEVGVSVKQKLSSLDVPGGPVPVRVDVSELPALPRGAAKPAEREWWDEAQRQATAQGGHQAVLVGPDGAIVDGGTASVWVVEGARLVTPPAPPAVAGVARAFLLASADTALFEITVEPVSWERFEAADEAFATNAFGGPVAFRDRGGPTLERVTELFARVWRASY